MSDEESKQTPSELEGKTLGQYELGRQLGQGGMATVYLAQQKSIGRTVAIKVMPMYFMHDPNFLTRFEREVQVIARLQHPRILPVYDYGQVEGRPYIVMAYMPGGTLADHITAPLPLDRILKLTDQIAEGLDHAHREGVIHRDFKPSNVLLDRSGNAHLADFGIAKISEATVALTGSGVVGTPAYMAPEMASEGVVTPAVDIYALGVTLYQMLTGKYPYSGDTPLRVMMAHATEPVPDARSLRPDLPPALSAVVQKAMAKDPMDRYPTAGELAAALREAASGRAGMDATVLEDVGKYETAPAKAVTPPPPGWTPTPPPVSTAPPPAYTPPPYTGTAAGAATGYPAPAAAEKRGCRGPVLIGGIVAGLAVLVCGGFLLLGGAASLAALFAAPTSTPFPTSTPAPPTSPPTSTDAPNPPTATPGSAANSFSASGGGGSGDGTFTELVIDNVSGGTLCYVYVIASGSSDWGQDQLGATEVIADGSNYTLTDIPTGQYDMKTEDCDHNLISWNTYIDLTGPSNTLTVSGSPDQVDVINNSSGDICVVYLSLSTEDTWGRNLIDSANAIPVGTHRLFPASAESWDMRVELCDGRNAERFDEQLSGVTTWTITD